MLPRNQFHQAVSFLNGLPGYFQYFSIIPHFQSFHKPNLLNTISAVKFSSGLRNILAITQFSERTYFQSMLRMSPLQPTTFNGAGYRCLYTPTTAAKASLSFLQSFN